MDTITTLTDAEFETRFKPILTPEGSIREWDWAHADDLENIERARTENLLWTALSDDDGEWCLRSGYHYVNRIYYVIVGVAFKDGEDFEVLDTPSISVSSNKLAEYIWDDDGEQESFKEFVAEGNNPTAHILWHAANVMGIAESLNTK